MGCCASTASRDENPEEKEQRLAVEDQLRDGRLVAAGAAYGGALDNSAFSESSNYGNDDTYLSLGRARLRCPQAGWAPNPSLKHDREQWVQVDLGADCLVAGVQTQGSHGFDEIACHPCESQQIFHIHFGQRPDDFVHIASGAEIAPRSSDDHNIDVGGICQITEQVSQFCVGIEGQRVFAFGSIESNGGNPALALPQEVPCFVAGE